jgi:ABC-type transporter Mla MlaB component
MLKITARRNETRTILELAGRLAGPWVDELRSCWQEAAEGDRQIEVLLQEVSFIDAAGRELLADMHRHGVRLAAAGCMTRAIIEQIKRGYSL